MEFIKENLLQNEKILHFVRPHWVIFSSGVWSIVLAIYLKISPPKLFHYTAFYGWNVYDILSAAFFIIGAYWIIDALIFYYTSEYGITNKRVIMKTGWIRRHSLEIMLEKVEGVLVDQTVFGRIFNYGLITIIGTGGTKDRFDYIPDPLLFRMNVQQQVDNLENKLGE